MSRRFFAVSILLMLTLVSAPIVFGGQPGVTGTVFNRRFIPQIKPMMTYEQIVKIVGIQGAKVGEEKVRGASIIHYRWKGEKRSVLNIRVSSGRLLDATVLAPNGNTYSIGRNGTFAQ
jgi:hypothetical protein